MAEEHIMKLGTHLLLAQQVGVYHRCANKHTKSDNSAGEDPQNLLNPQAALPLLLGMQPTAECYCQDPRTNRRKV